MQLSAILPAAVLVASVGLSALVLSRPTPPAEPEPATAMDLLRAYKCHRAETKQIIMRGIDDNFSPAGDEPNFVRDGRQSADNLTYFDDGSYDQVQMDRRFTDSFRAPANVTRGLFVIRLKAVGNNDSDTISIGDVSTLSDGWRPRSGAPVATLGASPGWRVVKDLYFGEFDAITLNGTPGRAPNGESRHTRWGTLLDFVRSGAADGWVDVFVQDDTAVDVIGAAICVEPARGKGISLSRYMGTPVPDLNITVMTCAFGGRDQYSCDPYVGDTPCSTPLPVACIRPTGAAMPKVLKDHYARSMWSGGSLAFTEPLAGERFRTIGEVNATCARRFGRSWRAAELHDGMHNMGIAGFGDERRFSGRAWIDVADAPYATCWTR